MIALPYVKEETVIELIIEEPIQVLCVTSGGVGRIDKKTFQFSAGETQVRLSAIPEGTEKISVTADIHNSQTLVELLLTLDAINRLEYLGPVELTLPYLPYSRQDRDCAPGESFSLSVLVNCLVPYLDTWDTVTTWDVHSKVANSLFKRKFKGKFYNRSAAELLNSMEAGGAVKFKPDTIVIAPDKGAVERASEVQDVLGLEKTVYATKVRNPDNGQILRTEVPDDVNYEGKTLLIVDDICDGGRTFIELAKVLRQHNPSRIDLYVTHGIFSKGFDVFENLIDHFYVANLLPNNLFYDRLPTNLTFIRNAA